MTVDGLMSTQTTFTHAGSRLPTAIECSVVAIIRQNVTSRIRARICGLGFEHVGDHVGQRAVVADAAGQQEIDVVLHAFVHDAGGEHALVDRVANRAAAANAVDRPQVMLVAGLGNARLVEMDAQAGAEERLLDVVRGQRVAGKQLVDVAAANQRAQDRSAAGVDDRRAADDQRLAAGSPVVHQLAGDLADERTLWAFRSRRRST